MYVNIDPANFRRSLSAKHFTKFKIYGTIESQKMIHDSETIITAN